MPLWFAFVVASRKGQRAITVTFLKWSPRGCNLASGLFSFSSTATARGARPHGEGMLAAMSIGFANRRVRVILVTGAAGPELAQRQTWQSPLPTVYTRA